MFPVSSIKLLSWTERRLAYHRMTTRGARKQLTDPKKAVSGRETLFECLLAVRPIHPGPLSRCLAPNLPPPTAPYVSSTMLEVGPEGSIIQPGAGLSKIAKTTFLVPTLIWLRIEKEADGCSKEGQYTVRTYVGQPQGRPNLPSPTAAVLIRRWNWRSGECTERFKVRARGRVGAIYALFRTPRHTTLKTTCSLRSLH